jgi:VIT1/CCC1 family predicted Fe2+/Mn2+ transporter
MKRAYVAGLSFGLTSGIITTLGLMAGLAAGTDSRSVVLGGILTIAIADALSDALGMHLSQESEGHNPTREVWEATVATLTAKFFVALTFVVPVVVLPLHYAVIASAGWALLLLTVLSYRIAVRVRAKPLAVIAEHVLITVVVIVLSHLVGGWVAALFNDR